MEGRFAQGQAENAQDDAPPPAYQRAGDDVTHRPHAANFNIKAGINIPRVNPPSAHAHLSVLRRFCALYNLVEESAGSTKDDAKAAQVELFLVCAESRYLSYLQLLELHYKNGQYEGRPLPLPPWDVAIIFHAHFLSPFRFYADMSCRDHRPLLLDSNVAFPLERLHHLITHNIWSDAESRQQWMEAFPQTPYQLWARDPFTTDSPLKLQDIDMVCPWCNKVILLELPKFALMHTRKNVALVCPNCATKFDADRLSCTNLRQDLVKNVESGQSWHVKGIRFDSDGNERISTEVQNDLSLILWQRELYFKYRTKKEPLMGTALARYLRIPDNDVNPSQTWKGFFREFQATVKELKSSEQWKDVSRRNIFARLRVAYQGLVWRDLSIDLVAAALRQRGFARKITGEECQGIDEPMALVHAISRYHKFMLLLKRSGGPGGKKHLQLVPTLDIDLCWHTHQLHPVEYRHWCRDHLQRLINHDDTISKDNVKDGLRTTSLAWFEAYREPYTTDDLKKEYLTTGRKVAAVLMPLYGLHVLNKSKKLEQTQRVGQGGEIPETSDERGYLPHYRRPYMSVYPYWTFYPIGWGFYPAACVNSGGFGNHGWGAGVCNNSNIAMAGAEAAGCSNGQCGSSVMGGACAGSSGACGGGNCSNSFGGGGSCGGGGGGCGGGGCGGGGC